MGAIHWVGQVHFSLKSGTYRQFRADTIRNFGLDSRRARALGRSRPMSVPLETTPLQARRKQAMRVRKLLSLCATAAAASALLAGPAHAGKARDQGLRKVNHIIL